jgi:RNA polymerase sigma-70 factor (ECF subfamily)
VEESFFIQRGQQGASEVDDESRIIHACIGGDRERFRVLVEKYQGLLLKTAFHFLGNWEDARDAAQEAFIRAYQGLEKFRQGSHFSAWLHRILVNVCKDRLKSADHRKCFAMPEALPDPENPGSHSLESLAERELLTQCLTRLTFKRRRVLILVDIQGFSSEEAAKILGCSASTIRGTLMKARRQLKEIYLSLQNL